MGDMNRVQENSSCEGCLSTDRKLSPIPDEESRKFVAVIVDPLACPISRLCWECLALLRRAVKFAARVRVARTRLTDCQLNKNESLTTLSQLSVTDLHLTSNLKLTPFSHTSQLNSFRHPTDTNVTPTLNDAIVNSADFNDTPMFNKLQNPTDLSLTPQVSYPFPIPTDLNLTPHSNKGPRVDSKVDLEFIKIEDSELDYGFFVDDLGNEEFKPVTKSDPFETEINSKYVRKTKKCRMRKKTNESEQFDESDDEPLTMKQIKRFSENRNSASERDICNSGKMKRGNRTKAKSKKAKNVGVCVDAATPSVEAAPAPSTKVSAKLSAKLRALNVEGLVEQVLLTWEQVESERQSALSNPQYAGRLYRCSHCAVGFNHRNKWLQHNAKHTTTTTTSSECARAVCAVCDVCTVRCKDERALAAHRTRHRARWRCTCCGALWSRLSVCLDHVSRQHDAIVTHTCNKCGHTADTLSKLRNHMKDHSERVKCELCDKSFRDRTSLRTHMFIHSGEKEFLCPHKSCNKRFLFHKALQLHQLSHEASRNIYCHTCDLTLKNSLSYYQHMRYNLKHISPHLLKYTCSKCDKKFARSGRLREHETAVHLKATPLRCDRDNCTFACASRPVLRAHWRSSHGSGSGVVTRNHVCHQCGNTYTTKKSLEGHLRAHSGERPFHCDRCPMTFGYQAALYNHNNIVHRKGVAPRTRAIQQQSENDVRDKDGGFSTAEGSSQQSDTTLYDAGGHVS